MFDQRQEADFRRIARIKQSAPKETPLLGPDVVSLFKQLEKRDRKLGKIADCWVQLVPRLLQEHTALEGFSRGTLSVLVDSSAHLYDLKQLLLAGLEKQLILACKSAGLRKVNLKPGRWQDDSELR
jgi:hypothetical protein